MRYIGRVLAPLAAPFRPIARAAGPSLARLFAPVTRWWRRTGRDWPWWLIIMLAIVAWMVVQILTTEGYGEAWENIAPGLETTLYLTGLSFVIAMPLGLFLSLIHISSACVKAS